MLRSLSPKIVTAKLLGIGVALIDNKCGTSPSVSSNFFVFDLHQNDVVCSSTTNKPNSLICTCLDNKA